MLKILIEEPVSYNTYYDVDNDSNWVYKNPTQEEINSIARRECFRILTYKDDFYLASGYYFTHCEMVNAFKTYNGLSLYDYKHYYISLKHDYIKTGDGYTNVNQVLKILKDFEPFICKLRELGLISDITRVYDYEIQNTVTVKKFYDL